MHTPRTHSLVQAGELLSVECELAWVDRMLAEACMPDWTPGPVRDADVQLRVSADRRPFDTAGWIPLTRGARHRDGAVVLADACGSGFDLRVDVDPYLPHARVRIEARFRPHARERAAARLLAARFHLLTRAALVQYPAMWVAGTRGRVVLHAAAVQTREAVVLLAGPGGVGRSTLLLQALADGGRACADNLCVSDGRRVHGVVEPVRIEGGGGRRMPHGRAETPLPGRVQSLVPECVAVLARTAAAGPTEVHALDVRQARFALSAGTYMAGELRRYWAFAATLAAATGRGPVHPPIGEVAGLLCRLPAVEIRLGARPVPSLSCLLAQASAVAVASGARPAGADPDDLLAGHDPVGVPADRCPAGASRATRTGRPHLEVIDDD